jgi:DNA repair metallo-beta-lactamase
VQIRLAHGLTPNAQFCIVEHSSFFELKYFTISLDLARIVATVIV